jgi:hypothetical protein
MGFHQRRCIKINGKYYHRYDKNNPYILPFLKDVIINRNNILEWIEKEREKDEDYFDGPHDSHPDHDDSIFIVDLDEMSCYDLGFSPRYDDWDELCVVSIPEGNKYKILLECFESHDNKIDLIANKLQNKSSNEIKSMLADLSFCKLLRSLDYGVNNSDSDSDSGEQD